MTQIDELYRLQQIDSEIREKKQRLREVLQAQKADQELQAAQKAHEAAAGALEAAQKEQRQLELELGRVNNKAKRSEERLYSGKVKNPKELEDLQQEIASLGRRRESLETEILETMVQVEEAQEEDRDTGVTLEEAESSWEKRVASLQREQNELAVRINELLERRQAQVKRIDSPMMKIYENTASKKGGVAVAGLKQELCQVCGVRTSSNKGRQAQAGELVYCGSCGRILAPV
jgi:predicted  nucleic acid-binding Zn-ribbon protein